MRQYFLNHSPIDAYFKQSKNDFVVDEVQLYEFSGEGQHLILQVRKKELTTWDMVNILSNHLGIKSNQIGYAGLKDKNALTSQYISIPKTCEDKLKDFSHPQIKILSQTYHNNKIRVGHLKGNRFFIRIKRVIGVNRVKIESALAQIAQYGMPNYFGHQRFGNEQNNYIDGESIEKNLKKIRDKKRRMFLLNSYQSHLFNKWLSKRVEISKIFDSFTPNEIKEYFKTSFDIDLDIESIKSIKSQNHPFKILSGDIMNHYPFGRIFDVEDLESESKRFLERDITPTGPLIGKKSKLSKDIAYEFEKEYENMISQVDGMRRFAWIFPQDISSNYKEKEAWIEIGFYLPKGSYATVLIEEILHKDLTKI
jgi:tRNA pseudouridine13 synthase